MNGPPAAFRRGFACACAAIVAATVCAACEPEPGGIDVELVIPRELAGAITTLQVAALPDPGSLPDCAALTRTCLKAEGWASSVEVSTTAPFEEAVAAGEGQVLLLHGLKVGSSYLVVVEAISESPPMAVEAAGCALAGPIKEGENDEVSVTLVRRTPATECDALL